MSKKAKKAYLALSHALGDMGEPPMCADSNVMDWFYPEGHVPKRGVSTAAMQHQMRIMELSAKRICQLCPIQKLCADYGLAATDEFGIWGGLSAADRKAIYASEAANKPEYPEATQLF